MDTIKETDIHCSDDISEILKTLCLTNEGMQKLIGKEFRYNMGKLAYNKEFCTIRLQCARRSGHSFGIAKFLSSLTGDWLVLAPAMHMTRYLHEKCSQINQDITRKNIQAYIFLNNAHIYFDTVNRIDAIKENNKKLEMGFNGVIVDGASILDKKTIKKVYSLSTVMNPSTRHFIFVG